MLNEIKDDNEKVCKRFTHSFTADSVLVRRKYGRYDKQKSPFFKPTGSRTGFKSTIPK